MIVHRHGARPDRARGPAGVFRDDGGDVMAASFLPEPPVTPAVQALYDQDVADDGYVMNVSRVDGYLPEAMQRLLDLANETFEASGLGPRQKAILVVATASALGDSYCSLVWGGRLAEAADAAVA